MERLRISPKERSPQAIAASISDAKNALIALQLTGGEHVAQESAARIIDDLEKTPSRA